MTRLRPDSTLSRFRAILVLSVLSVTAAMAGPSEWRHQQDFNVASNGLVKISLPGETLDAARPDLEDLRVWDESGELAYWIERPEAEVRSVEQPVKAFDVRLNANNTVITIDTGAEQPIDNVLLSTPASGFVKAARVEGATNGGSWQELATGMPLFRQWHGVDHLRLSLPTRAWIRLRLTIDDRRSEPVPFTGASVRLRLSKPGPVETQEIHISNRHENRGETRLTLDLGAANLSVAAVELNISDPLFARNVSLAEPKVTESGIVEWPVASGSIYRVALEGQSESTSLTVPVEAIVPSRELIALIHNLDSPPLTITGARVVRRPVYLVFMARKAGPHHLFMGNSRCASPRYDLGLSARLESLPLGKATLGPVKNNPDYHPPEALPGIELTGSAWSPDGWACRAPILLSAAGAHDVELTPAVLAHAAASLADLRVGRGSNQLPYLLERTSIMRAVRLQATLTNDPAHHGISRWALRLPVAGLPIASIDCSAQSPLFQRQMTLYEETLNPQGNHYKRVLGAATWIQTPQSKSARFAVLLNGAPQGDLLSLETDNGDNPALELEQFDGSYGATRVLFKAKAGEQLYLYYGNPNATAPQYDLGLVASELLLAEKAIATLGPEERLTAAQRTSSADVSGGFLFWAVLALVVIALLIVVARLLPKAPRPDTL